MAQSGMKTNALIMAYGPDQKGLLLRLLELIADNDVYVVDLKFSVFRQRFVVNMLVSTSRSKAELGEIVRKLPNLETELGLTIKVDILDSAPPVSYGANVVVVAYGSESAYSKVLKRFSRSMTTIVQTIAANDGNVESADFETDLHRLEHHLVVTATIPPSIKLDVIREQLALLQGEGVKVVVQHEEVFRYIQRIETEREVV